jgi:hypothetical protein
MSQKLLDPLLQLLVLAAWALAAARPKTMTMTVLIPMLPFFMRHAANNNGLVGRVADTALDASSRVTVSTPKKPPSVKQSHKAIDNFVPTM